MPCHNDAQGLEWTTAERPRYFEGQLFTAEDLRDEQGYWVRTHRFHNLALHGSGVVCGLGVASQEGRAVTIGPGIAIDPLGREIVVPEPVEILVAAEQGEGDVVLRYREEPARWSVNGETTRIQEGFEVLVGSREETSVDGVVLASLQRSERKELTVVLPNDVWPGPSRRVLEVLAALVDRVAELEEAVAEFTDRDSD